MRVAEHPAQALQNDAHLVLQRDLMPLPLAWGCMQPNAGAWLQISFLPLRVVEAPEAEVGRGEGGL